MPSINNIIQPVSRKIARATPEKFTRYFIENNAGFLMWTSALTFSLSSAGQAVSVLHNKKLPENERKFIFNQEVITGGINLASLLGLTKSFAMMGEFAIKKGFQGIRFLPRLLSEDKHELTHEQTIKKVDQYFKDVRKDNFAKEIKGMGDDALKPAAEILEKQGERLPGRFFAQIDTHVKATKTVSSIIGTIVALNIFAPLLRNFLASKITKKELKELNTNNSSIKGEENIFSKFQKFKKELSGNNPYKASLLSNLNTVS